MKKISKLLAVCMTAVLVFGSAVTVFAAPSTDTATAETSVANVSATTADGVPVTVAPVTQAKVAEAKNVAASLLGTSGVKIERVFDLVATLSGPTDITISVPGITAGQKIAVLHQKSDGKWESVPVKKVAAGSVTATFTSLSPVAIVSYDAATSPKTGESLPAAGMISIFALLGAVVCFKKRQSKSR